MLQRVSFGSESKNLVVEILSGLSEVKHDFPVQGDGAFDEIFGDPLHFLVELL